MLNNLYKTVVCNTAVLLYCPLEGADTNQWPHRVVPEDPESHWIRTTHGLMSEPQKLSPSSQAVTVLVTRGALTRSEPDHFSRFTRLVLCKGFDSGPDLCHLKYPEVLFCVSCLSCSAKT